MANDIGPKIGLDGEKEFKKQISDVNATLGVLDSEMKLVTSAFDANDKSTENLTKQNEVYQKQVSALTTKLDAQKNRLNELTAAYGENDPRVKKMQSEVNKTEAQINTYNRKLEENTETVKENGRISLDSFAKIGEAAASMAAAAGKAIAGMASSLFSLVTGAGEAADELNTLSKTTGMSTEELQKLQYASSIIDVDVETMAKSITKLTSNMSSAANGSKSASKAFADLGIEITNSDGSLRDSNDVFNEAIAALSNIENETERDAAAMALFGKSAKDLNPLIQGGADALAALGQEAEDAGLILSGPMLDKLNGVSDAMDRLKGTGELAKNLFAVGFAEPISAAIDKVTEYVQRLTAAFADGGLEGMLEELPNVIKDMNAEISAALPEFSKIASEIITALIDGLIEAAPDIIAAAANIVLEVGSSLLSQAPEIFSSGVSLSTTLIEGLVSAIPDLIQTAVEMIVSLTEALLSPEMIGALTDSAIKIVFGLLNGIIGAIPTLLEAAPTIVAGLVQAIVENVPKLLRAAGEIVVTLVKGIIENVPRLIQAAVSIVTTLWSGIKQLASQIWNIGKDIFNSIYEGFKKVISGALTWGKDLIDNFVQGIKNAINKVKDAIGNVASKIKSFLGFSEPEEGPLSDFHTYGPDMMKLYAQGIRDNAWRVEDAVDGVASGMSMSLTPDISVADALAGAVNGMQTATAGLGLSGLTVKLMLPDNTELASYYLNSFINTAAANGTPIANPA